MSPVSDEAAAIVRRFAGTMATAAGHEDEGAMRAHLRTKHDPRGARYWELVAILRGTPIERFDDWTWLGEAMREHLSAA